jgi:type IV secretory pathway VirB9-like protein
MRWVLWLAALVLIAPVFSAFAMRVLELGTLGTPAAIVGAGAVLGGLMGGLLAFLFEEREAPLRSEGGRAEARGSYGRVKRQARARARRRVALGRVGVGCSRRSAGALALLVVMLSGGVAQAEVTAPPSGGPVAREPVVEPAVGEPHELGPAARREGERPGRGSREAAEAKPVTGERAWNEHELRLRRGWVAVEQELDLRALDIRTLEARAEAEEARDAEGPSVASDGSIQFVYGEGSPTLFCRPLTTCDIALQEGEHVVSYTTGTGEGGAWIVGMVVNPYNPDVQTPQPHITVRPKRHTAERTNLTVWTDRRAYHLDLVVSETPMRFVSFRYPQDEKAALLAAASARASRGGGEGQADNGGPFSPRPWEWNRQYESECASRFWVCRRIKWMEPESVLDDGNVTQITLPREALSNPRPVFHVISPTGDRIEVNYSVHGRTYVVPQLFDEGSLIIAHGTKRRHVLEYRIRRVGE